MSIIKKRLFRVFIFSLCLILSPLFSLRSSLEVLDFSDKIHKVSTVNGVRQGFFITSDGHFLTNYDIVSDLSSASIKFSNEFSENAFRLRASYLESYSLLKVERDLSSSEILSLGDSDSVDIGDMVYMADAAGNLSSGKVLFKLPYFNEYSYPCFISDFDSKETSLGSPVFSIENKVIGIFSSYKGNYFILPINRIKPLVKDSLRKAGDIEGDTYEEEASNLNVSAVRQFGSNMDYTTGFISDISFDREHNLYFLDSGYKSLGKIYMGGLYKELSSDISDIAKPLNNVDDETNGEVKSDDVSGEQVLDGTSDETIEERIEEGEMSSNLKSSKDALDGFGTVKRMSFEEPISFAVSDMGLIYVLDRAQKSIVILNKDFVLVDRLDYSKISPLFEPIKLRFFGDVLIVETDTGKYYRLLFDKSLGKTKAILLKGALNMRDNKRLQDVSYGSDYSYWLFSSSSPRSSSLYIVGNDFNVKSIVSLPGSFSSSLAVYKDNIYILDRETRRISIYNKAGNFLRYWNAPIDMNGGSQPTGIRISSYGVLAVFYSGFSSFNLFSMDGKLIKKLSPLDKEGGVTFPISLAYNGELGKLALVGEGSSFYLFSFEEEVLERPNGYEEDMEGSLGGAASTKLNKKISMSNGDKEVDILPKDGDDTEGGDLGVLGAGSVAGAPFARKLLLKGPLDNPALRGLCTVDNKFFVSDVNSSLLISFPYDAYDKIAGGSYGSSMGKLAVPVQLAYLNKELFILDKGNNRVVVTDKASSLLRSFLLRDKSSSLLYGQDIALSDSGKVFVLASNKVFIYGSGGELLKEFSIKRGENSYLGYAKGIAWGGGVIYVSDTYNNRILVYNEDGVLDGSFGSKGGGLGNFHHPWDIAVYGSSLYVVDRGNHRAVLYSLGE